MSILKKLSGMSGLGSQILVAVDTQSDELRNICHFIRFETIRFNKDDTFGDIKFSLPHVANDPRLQLMPEIFTQPAGGKTGFIPSGTKVTAEYTDGVVCMTPGSHKGKKCFLIETEHFKTGRKTVIGCSPGGMKAIHECSKHMIDQL